MIPCAIPVAQVRRPPGRARAVVEHEDFDPVRGDCGANCAGHHRLAGGMSDAVAQRFGKRFDDGGAHDCGQGIRALDGVLEVRACIELRCEGLQIPGQSAWAECGVGEPAPAVGSRLHRGERGARLGRGSYRFRTRRVGEQCHDDPVVDEHLHGSPSRSRDLVACSAGGIGDGAIHGGVQQPSCPQQGDGERGEHRHRHQVAAASPQRDRVSDPAPRRSR